MTIAPLRAESPASRDAAPRDVNVQPVLTALKSSPFFASWTPASVSALALATSLRSFSAGQVVLADDAPPDHAVLVVRGRLRVVRRAARGREVTLEVFRPGELCADALLDGAGPLGCEWIAAETTLLAFISRDELANQLRANPDAALVVAASVGRRLRDARALAAGLVLDDVERRLYDTLARLARDDGELVPEGTLVRRCPTQQELANRIGACRETVSRIVAELGRKGAVSLNGRRLTLHPTFFEVAGLPQPVADAPRPASNGVARPAT